MKKNLLLCLFMFLGVSASADDFTSVKNTSDDVAVPVSELTVVAPAPIVKKAPVADDVDISGTYVSKNIRKASSYQYQSSYPVTITKTAEGYDVTGIKGIVDATVKATFDASTGTLSIAPGQKISENATYGDLSLQPSPSTATSIDFVYNPTDNSLTLAQTGLLMMDSEKIYYFGAQELSYTLHLSNGTIDSELLKVVDGSYVPDTPSSFPSCVSVDKESKTGFIAGVDGITWQSFSYSDDGVVTLVQEPAHYYSATYDVAKWSKIEYNEVEDKISYWKTLAPEASIDIDGGSLDIGPWAFYMVRVSDSANVRLNGPKLNSVASFVLPTPTSIDNSIVDNTTVASVRKVAENGRVYIQKGDVRYNLQGARIK